MLAGEHEYGAQLDGQLRLVGLPRAGDAAAADLVVLCGLAGGPEVSRAAAAGLPVVAFDGVQGGPPVSGLRLVLAVRARRRPRRHDGGRPGGCARGRRAPGRRDRLPSLLAALRALGPFDEHGDPVDPPVWLWRAAEDWAVEAERPL